MNTTNKSLLVRADFVLGNRRGGDRLMCKRWRRALADALPRLLGCADRRPSVRVRLHEGEGEARFTGWLRIPIERRPSRRRLRKFKAKLRARLEAGLLPIDGEVLKLGVRRCQPHLVQEPDLFSALREQRPLMLPAPEVTVPAEPSLSPPALEAAAPASLQSL